MSTRRAVVVATAWLAAVSGAVADRRFDRARHDAQRTVAEFSDRMRDELDLADVSGDLDATIRDAISPRTFGIWLRESKR